MTKHDNPPEIERIWKQACVGREGYCSSDLQAAAKWAISEAFRLSIEAAKTAALPERYEWSEGNREKFDFGRDRAVEAIAALAASPIASDTDTAIPGGWKLVPIEPTEAMVEAALLSLRQTEGYVDQSDRVPPFYRHMLAAFPKPDTDTPVDPGVEGALLRGANISRPAKVVNHVERGNGTAMWSEVMTDRPNNSQIAHCADQEDADLIAHLINTALAAKPIAGMDAGEVEDA